MPDYEGLVTTDALRTDKWFSYSVPSATKLCDPSTITEPIFFPSSGVNKILKFKQEAPQLQHILTVLLFGGGPFLWPSPYSPKPKQTSPKPLKLSQQHHNPQLYITCQTNTNTPLRFILVTILIPTPLWSLLLSLFARGGGGTLPVTRAVTSTNKHESDDASADSWSSGTGTEFPSSASVFETYVKPVLNESSIGNVKRLARNFKDWFRNVRESMSKIAGELYDDDDLPKAKVYTERQAIVERFYEKHKPLLQDHYHQLIALEERKANQFCGFDEGDNTSHSTTDLTADEGAAKPPRADNQSLTRLNVLSHNKAAIDNTKSVFNVVKPPPPAGVDTSTVTETRTPVKDERNRIISGPQHELLLDVERKIRSLREEKASLHRQLEERSSFRERNPENTCIKRIEGQIKELDAKIGELKIFASRTFPNDYNPKVADLDQNQDGHQHANPLVIQNDDLLRQCGDLQKESQSCDKEAQDSVLKSERIVEEIIKTRGRLRYLSGRMHELEDSYEDLRPPLDRALRAGMEGVDHLRKYPPRDGSRLTPRTRGTDRESHPPKPISLNAQRKEPKQTRESKDPFGKGS